MHLLFSPIGATLLYIGLAMLVALVGRRRRMGFWGFFWASLLLTPLVTGFFVLMAGPPPRVPLRRTPRKPPTR